MAHTTKKLAMAFLLFPLAVSADEATESFVEGNLLSIFYHELGHALIDIEQVPIFGQEEDAADVFSMFLIDALFEDDVARQTAKEAALGFLHESALRDHEDEEIAWWDVHGPDEQRFYNTLCIFYGAAPDERAGFAEDLRLPQERAENCPAEYDQAADAWGMILDETMSNDGGGTILLDTTGDFEGTLTFELMEAEVTLLNEDLELSQQLLVLVEPCGEANVFYDPSERKIVMCIEFEEHLQDLATRI